MKRAISGVFAVRWAVCLLVMLMPGASLEAAGAPGSLGELIAGARAEGALNVTWGPGGGLGGAESPGLLEEGLNRAYGLKIKINYTPGATMPQLAARLVQETRAGMNASFDVFFGTEAHIPSLVSADVLEPVRWSDFFPHIVSDMHEFGGRALRAYTFFPGVQYNSKLVRFNEVPRKTGDVFKPHWKGKIASTIYAAQFDRLALIKGVEETRTIVHKTAEWAGGLIRCGDEERIVSGEFLLLFLTCTQQRTEVLKSQGAPIDYTLLDDGLMTGFAYVAVPKNSPHPNLAKLFLGYVVSKEGQAILDKFGYSLHLVEGTKSHKRYHVYAQRGLKFQENSATEAVGRSDEIHKLREEFQKILQRK